MKISEEIIVQVLQLLVAVFTIVKVYVVNRKVNTVNQKVETVHNDVNGKMDKLLKVSKDAATAEGDKQGRANLKAEQQAEAAEQVTIAEEQKKQIDENTQRIIDEVTAAIVANPHNAGKVKEVIDVVITENQDKEVIIKKNLDK